MIQCTGIAAVWCPIHGNCSCPYLDERTGERDMNDPGCALHGKESTHPDSKIMEAKDHEEVLSVFRLGPGGL